MKCDECGEDISGLGYTCNECGKMHCSTHRLPEAHSCRGMKRFEIGSSKASTQPQKSGANQNRFTPVKWLSDGFWFIISIPMWILANIIGFLKFTYHYPASGLWKLTKIGLVMVSLIVVAGFAGIGPIDSPNEQLVSPAESAASNFTESSEMDEAESEELVRERINNVRADRNLVDLSAKSSLSRQARSHSENMAERGKLAHDLPGSTAEERLNNAGCVSGGENVAQTWLYENIETEDGTDYLNSEEELADSLVEQWMNSPGHRDVILSNDWAVTGVGIEITDENKVYATQMFCV